MNGAELADQFSARVNAGLAVGRDDSAQTYADLAGIARDSGLEETLEQLRTTFAQALHPTRFADIRVWQVDDRFEQCYELLRRMFAEDERDPRDRFIAMVNGLRNPANLAPIILMGRYWKVVGPQIYTPEGALKQFTFDPLALSEHIVGVVSANYMSLDPVGREGQGIGAIGHLATREHFQRGYGHGSALLESFEDELNAIAKSQQARVTLIALEAQEDSQAFWYKRGYRWASGTKYAQPPLDFDPVTGERIYDEVPETLMVKIPGQPDATTVDARLLADAVRVMYQNWSLAKVIGFPPAAIQRATDYVIGKVFAEFEASLPSDGAPVSLTPPPHLL
jgi:ribosomal protein S18 acetylase RimI-like enzyme